VLTLVSYQKNGKQMSTNQSNDSSEVSASGLSELSTVESSLLTKWEKRLRRSIKGHYEATRRLEKRHYLIGTLLISTSVISTVFSGRSLFRLDTHILDEVITVTAALSLVFSCLHVFLQDIARAERHRRTAEKLSELKRQIELIISRQKQGIELKIEEIDAFRVQMDDIYREIPAIPAHFWNAINTNTDNK
jgi:hypothetical protein